MVILFIWTLGTVVRCIGADCTIIPMVALEGVIAGGTVELVLETTVLKIWKAKENAKYHWVGGKKNGRKTK